MVWNADGTLVAARGMWFAEQHRTNNTAEMAALVELMRYLVTPAARLLGRVNVVGDSKLIVDFCRRASRPGKPELFVGMRQVQDLSRQLSPRPVFLHVPREANDFADWLAGVARVKEADMDLSEICRGMPLGSLRPCPPIRAAQILDELQGMGRPASAGSIGTWL